MSLLRVRDLKVNYGGIEALKGISFDVEKGQIVTLIGANGAGKSTTLRAISGLVPVKSGTITYDGNVIAGQQPQPVMDQFRRCPASFQQIRNPEHRHNIPGLIHRTNNHTFSSFYFFKKHICQRQISRAKHSMYHMPGGHISH